MEQNDGRTAGERVQPFAACTRLAAKSDVSRRHADAERFELIRVERDIFSKHIPGFTAGGLDFQPVAAQGNNVQPVAVFQRDRHIIRG